MTDSDTRRWRYSLRRHDMMVFMLLALILTWVVWEPRAIGAQVGVVGQLWTWILAVAALACAAVLYQIVDLHRRVLGHAGQRADRDPATRLDQLVRSVANHRPSRVSRARSLTPRPASSVRLVSRDCLASRVNPGCPASLATQHLPETRQLLHPLHRQKHPRRCRPQRRAAPVRHP
jgi:hypothetical protein